MIDFRVMLSAMTYVLRGRADWLGRKAQANRKATSATRTPGRLREADRVAALAGAIGRRMHEVAQLPVPAELVGLALARAAGDLSGGDVLREMIAAAAGPLREELDWLVAVGALPAARPE